ncbi:hypothetical protein [Sphaerospermopsis sp. FACHB-1194]|nr:hypothetical protein [Sphaerospermopsis sp. FACHB-1194]
MRTIKISHKGIGVRSQESGVRSQESGVVGAKHSDNKLSIL